MAAELEIVCIGNELLIGKVVNTNASWIGKKATDLGIKVKRVTVCADDLQEIASVIREALSRKPKFVITTGGLGPTFDDKTLQGISIALQKKWVVNVEAFRMVQNKYVEYVKSRNIETPDMTEPRVKMATFPEGTKPLFNPVGTAPGMQADIENTVLFALPGVPKEMEAIFELSVVPLLRQASENGGFYQKSIYADNIMESILAPLIDKVMQDNCGVYIKSHPKGMENQPHMELHFSILEKNPDRAEALLREAVAQMVQLIRENGGKIYPEKHQTDV
ncbi:MAG: molybdopterin-binding protein [Candidatus Bathyarchaeota archaeon]|nr:molybdopterin-binding protein [Candidatus Bathyarchaeota archaeon]